MAAAVLFTGFFFLVTFFFFAGTVCFFVFLVALDGRFVAFEFPVGDVEEFDPPEAVVDDADAP